MTIQPSPALIIMATMVSISTCPLVMVVASLTSAVRLVYGLLPLGPHEIRLP